MLWASSGRRRLDGAGSPGRMGIRFWFLCAPLGLLAGVACCWLRGLLATPLFLPSRAVSATPTLSSLRPLGFSVLNSLFLSFFFLCVFLFFLIFFCHYIGDFFILLFYFCTIIQIMVIDIIIYILDFLIIVHVFFSYSESFVFQYSKF